MAIAAQYSDFYPYMVTELPGCLDNVMLQHLRRAGRTFCQDTEAWREELTPIRILDWKQDYALTSQFTATVRRILWARLNGAEVSPDYYELVEDATLRFSDDYVLNDQTAQLLTCGAAGTAVIATWAAVTNASVTFTVDDDTYSITGITFAGLTTMAAIALAIQTALRTSMESNEVVVRFYNDRFYVYTEGSSVGYLTAGSGGTDISGSGFMNGLTVTGTLGPLLLVNAVLMPQLLADTMPDHVMERWSEAIIALALETLLGIPETKWFNERRAEFYGLIYRKFWNKARSENLRILKDGAANIGC